MVAAVEGADELIVGLNGGLDAALVLRGVPASLDPEKVTDTEGRALFRPARDAGGLFVLPERTWAFALGGAREVFATPRHRPKPEIDAGALAVVRVSGGLRRVFERHPAYAPLSRKLASATFSLRPGKEGLVVAFAYEDVGATAWAEMHAKRLVEERAKQAGNAWLRAVKVAYEGNTVLVRGAIPPRLLEELPNVTGADLGL